MKRSEINAVLARASSIFEKHGWTLPPEPKWDITDFGLHDFSKYGLVLVNLCEERPIAFRSRTVIFIAELTHGILDRFQGDRWIGDEVESIADEKHQQPGMAPTGVDQPVDTALIEDRFDIDALAQHALHEAPSRGRRSIISLFQ